MIRFVNRGANGYSLIDVAEKRVHTFDGIKRVCICDDAGFSPSNVEGSLEVDVLSVLRLGLDSCEVFLDLGTHSEKYEVNLTNPSLLQQIFKISGFFIALSRDFVVDGHKYTQNIFVYPSGSRCNNVVSKIGGSCNVQFTEKN